MKILNSDDALVRCYKVYGLSKFLIKTLSTCKESNPFSVSVKVQTMLT